MQKTEKLREYCQEKKIDSADAVYVGNDVNDIACFPVVGCALVPSDAHEKALAAADIVLTRTGGHGAVREACDRILDRGQS